MNYSFVLNVLTALFMLFCVAFTLKCGLQALFNRIVKKMKSKHNEFDDYEYF